VAVDVKNEDVAVHSIEVTSTVAREFMVCFWNFWITAIEILNSVSGWEKFSACLRQCYALWLCFMTLYIML
jgi:hypothetical protein